MMQPKFIHFLASLKATKEEIMACNITLGLGQVKFDQFISDYKVWHSKGNREPLPTAVLLTVNSMVTAQVSDIKRT
jgi:hypothetical protein